MRKCIGMSDSPTVSVEDVRRVAELASLELTPEEETRMLRDLNAILEHVSQLNELDTSAVLPMAQVSEVIGNSQPQGTLRPDERRPSLDHSGVMASAPETNGTFFKVPKVIER
jgi:aspartyl-tRNA(Asn)/glutamyl-tRNA(Gln) amidotransferase subunit C